MSFFVPTRFVWRFGGRQVHLCGSFTRWVETVPMALVEGSPGVFAVVVHLPPGYHQYKFIVDGKWRHDETAPFMPDPLGNVNNWLFVRRIETTPAPSISPLTFDQQQLYQQQQAAAAAATAAAAAAAAAQQQQQQQFQVAAAQALLQNASAAQQVGQYQALQPGHGPGANSQRAPTSGGLSSIVGGLSVTSSQSDEVMAEVGPVVIHNPKEPEYTRKKIGDFLHSHSAYELIPESGKVVVLDVDLPVRQAFHALHEQGVASAPLWDARDMAVIGVLSASDFIKILKRMRHSVSAGANAMSEAEMDFHSIRGLREEAVMDGTEPRPLISVRPDEDLARVVSIMFSHKCSMAPVLAADPTTPSSDIPSVLHLATLSAVLACLMRHFRASLGSLPLLSQPLGSLPLGTWSPDAGVAHTELLPEGNDRRQWRRLQPLQTVTPSTSLTTALSMLLEAGVSALPVVDDKRVLLDIYARSDITQLCKGNAYNRLQWEDVTVGQALTLASPGPTSWSQPSTSPSGSSAPSFAAGGAPIGGLSAEFAAQQAQRQQAAQQLSMLQSVAGAHHHHGDGAGPPGTRVFVCTKDDSLRTVVERLAIPGVRRLIIVHPDTRRVDGLISLSDVAGYLFL